tara:strand:+ start:174 stop:461 length:288 start_codon:yes stop_codon:yes gene_type:complete
MKDEDVQAFMRETVKIIQYMGMDIVKLQTMVYNLLDDMGKMDRVPCHSCGEEIIRPLLPNIPLEDMCPMCGSDLFEKSQTSVEDWDNGVVSDESE